jgi:type I restriction enzyme S subunit
VELRPGYRKTDVGVVPEDWDVGGLGKFWTARDCKHVTARFADSGDFPIASINEVQSRFVDLTNAKRTTQRFFDALIEGGRKPRPGDLIMSRNATVGQVAQVAEWHPPFAMGQDVCLLRKTIGEFSTGYLQEIFCSPIIANQLSDFMVGSTFKRVNVQQIRGLAVPMPSPAEQEAIAEVLSDADGLIESLEQLIAKKRQIKQGAMQELLTGKERLAGFGGALTYRHSDVGLIPEDWHLEAVHEFARIQTGPFGTLLKASEYSEGDGVPLISVGEIRPGFLSVTDETPRVPDIVTRRLPQYVLRNGDIVFARKGGVERSALVREWQQGWFLGSDGISIRPAPGYSCTYLALQFQSAAVQGWLLGNAIGTTMPSLNQQILRDLVIPIPPSKAEQSAIAAVLSDVDADIDALEKKLDKARRIKQGMMQELLTGKIRLI